MKTTIFSALNGLMAIVFLLSAGAQHNDPDAGLWIIVYSLALFFCLLYILQKLQWWLPLILSVITLIWAVVVAGSLTDIPFGEIFSSMNMGSIGVEEAREVGGLLIIGLWMLALGIRLKFSDRHTS